MVSSGPDTIDLAFQARHSVRKSREGKRGQRRLSSLMQRAIHPSESPGPSTRSRSIPDILPPPRRICRSATCRRDVACSCRIRLLRTVFHASSSQERIPMGSHSSQPIWRRSIRSIRGYEFISKACAINARLPSVARPVGFSPRPDHGHEEPQWASSPWKLKKRMTGQRPPVPPCDRHANSAPVAAAAIKSARALRPRILRSRS
ncbi:hypothetical protein SAMN05216548_102369 [Faunimonas pinastri]|uniref:Uncharacterized protein n=1 Tax=Faunimonas pinastri TaxID=1855383 RepID=A0A1H9D759_9HYPH|nr:hypothetical protein SAMN05216548_102369 [Faunimonas pinastri]